MDTNFSFYDSDFNDTQLRNNDDGGLLINREDIEAQIRRTLFCHHKDPIVIILLVLYIITFLCGFVGNILVIYIFTRRNKMRTVTHVFLVNLAICDLLVVCLCMPFTAIQAVYSDWIYGDIWCKLMNYLQGVSVISSILTLTVISAERFYAVRRPMHVRTILSRERVNKAIVTIYVISAATMIPSLLVRHQLETGPVYPPFSVTIRTCMETWPSDSLKHTYNFSQLVLLYLGPVIFICIGYSVIGSDLWKTDSTLFATQDPSRISNAIAARRKVAKMLFVIALLFGISWIPFNILLVTLDFIPEEVLKEKGFLIRYIVYYALWLGHANSSVNPICYCIMSESFKKGFSQEFKRCFRRHKFQQRESFVSHTNSVTMTTNYPRSKNGSCIYKTSAAAYKLVNINRKQQEMDKETKT